MKKQLLLSLLLSIFLVSGYSQTNTQDDSKKITTKSKKHALKAAKPDKKTKELRKKHAYFLKNSPFKETLKLKKTERKALGIPPKKYYEMEWELTMNPETGRPTPENLLVVKSQLEEIRQQALLHRTPGDALDNLWVERGPTNVGGRTRAVMFDPNDPTNETVFAGSVSGGLYKNTNISNANSTWTRVNTPDNLAVSCITYDPNNTNIFYVGTGESYVQGDVNGNGLWKSTDAGTTWTKVLGGISGPTTFQSASNITINTPSGVAGNYVCYPTNPANFGTAITTTITADIVLVNDGTAPTSDACESIVNNVAGKIALIRRGDCTFVIKVKAAQDAGAIGVIMMNNVTGQPIPMGGTDTTITIPSVMISKEDGDLLEATLASGSMTGSLNPTGDGFTGNLVPGIQHINDVKVRNNGGVSEVYVAAAESYYSESNALTFLGGPAYGLYKSTNGGSTWNEVNLPLTDGGKKHCPNNIEFGSDNKIWVSTKSTYVFGEGGGKVFSSTDGVNFIQNYAVTNGRRTEIAVSKTTPGKVYVLAELSQASATVPNIETTIVKTTNAFASSSTMTLPVDADPASRFTNYGFTGQQAFFDLFIELDPTNDETVYVGGIDLFKSVNGASSWSQLSHWTGAYAQYVHSDQHAVAFGHGATSKLLFGNDGGVYFSSNSGTAIASRNKGFNATQFYSVGVAPTTNGMTGDNFVAGAQDNGSQMFLGATAGLNESSQVQGGDGAYSFMDTDGTDRYRITNYVYNNSINLYNYANSQTRVINSETTENGAFIAPMALDSNMDILYSDYTNTSGTTPLYQIRRYARVKGPLSVQKTTLTNALLTSSPTAFTVSKFGTPTTSSTLLVGTRNAKLLKITNANAASPTWTDITGPAFVGSVSDVEYGTTENEIFVTMHNYNVVSIWYTNDGGATWQNKEGNLPDIPVKAVLKNPLNANEVIVGTELGVWFTNTFNTASPTWNQSFNGMSNVKVTDLDLRNDNVVFASTYGRGVFSGAFTSTTLSNDDIVKSNGIKVYPNPSNGTINLNINDFTGKINIQLFDIKGQVVYSDYNVDFSLEKTINFNKLSTGLYILKVSSDNLNYTEKIIIE